MKPLIECDVCEHQMNSPPRNCGNPQCPFKRPKRGFTKSPATDKNDGIGIAANMARAA